jgi:hypothetical protein
MEQIERNPGAGKPAPGRFRGKKEAARGRLESLNQGGVKQSGQDHSKSRKLDKRINNLELLISGKAETIIFAAVPQPYTRAGRDRPAVDQGIFTAMRAFAGP